MRAKSNQDWVPIQNYFLEVAVATAGFPSSPISSLILAQSEEVAEHANLAALRPIATASFQDDFTTLRVVGQVLRQLISAEAGIATFRGLIAERIHVGLLDRVTPNTVAIVPDDLFLMEDAEERFVWQRYTSFEIPQDTQGLFPYLTRADYEIDVRTKRRISEGEALIYSSQLFLEDSASSGTGITYLTRHMLRTLCKT